MIATITTVEDLERFLDVFSSVGLDKRREHGCRAAHVFRDPEDGDRLWVFLDWDHADYQRFLSDPSVPAIAQQLALREPPTTEHPIASYEH